MFTQELITYVFGALQALERYIEQTKSLLEKDPALQDRLPCPLSEQDKVVQHMRRIANKLQFEIAKKDWEGVVRMLKLFYGLDALVRSDIISTFVSLSGGRTSTVHHSPIVLKEAH